MSRQKKISSLLRTEISSLLLKKINDSRIGFISITEIKISTDFKQAWIYYSQIGSDQQKEDTKKGLSSATKFIHSELSKTIRYMAIPKIRFRFDDSIEKGVNLVNKINQLNK
jgi:ribosome-binding factor A